MLSRAAFVLRAVPRTILFMWHMGMGFLPAGLARIYGAERLGCMVVPMSGGASDRQVQLIQDF